MPTGKMQWIGAGCLALLIFSFLWSAVLHVLLKFDIASVTPWSVYSLLFQYGPTRIGVDRLGISAGVAAAVIVGGIIALWVTRPPTYYGDARWARRDEMERAYLFDRKGILLGKHGSTYVRNDEPAHVLIAAPTRSGKGVGVVLPNLLNFDGSVIVLDIKHENFKLTSGWRAQSSRVFQWSPMADDERSHGYNPLDAIRPEPRHRISDIQRMATMLLPAPHHSEPMWQNEARDLFLGVTLFVLDDQEMPSTIGQVYRVLKSDRDLAELIEEILAKYQDELDPSCRMSLANFAHKAPKERSGVKSSLTSALNLWANPIIDAATSKSDFRIDELRRRRTSVYIGVKQNEIATLAPLVNLFLQQCIDILGRDLPAEDEPHQVMMLIDEFALLGRMSVLETALAFLAGYNVRLVLVIQGLSQLKQLYGQAWENILQNTAIQVYFAPNDIATANYLSQRLGTKTIRTHNYSQSGSNWERNRSTSHTGRALMLPEEVRQLSGKKSIIIKEKARPAKVNKLEYFSNRDFKQRLLPAIETPKLALPETNVKKLLNSVFEKAKSESDATPTPRHQSTDIDDALERDRFQAPHPSELRELRDEIDDWIDGEAPKRKDPKK